MTRKRTNTRAELRRMFWHDYVASIADNMVEVNWVLVVTMFPIMTNTDSIVAMFGITDTLWALFSFIYYGARTAMDSTLPEIVAGGGGAAKPLKNAWYLAMAILTPPVLVAMVFTPQIMTMLGAPDSELHMYVNYFRFCLVSIWAACPAGLLIPAYLRATFQNKTALFLDHAVTWVMAVGCWITVHIMREGVLSMMVVNIIANSIPMVWFLWKRPLKGFFCHWEFDPQLFRKLFNVAKWELVRRSAPRTANLFTSTSLMLLSPALVGVRYIIGTVYAFISSLIEVSYGLSVIDASHNQGLGIDESNRYNNHTYLQNLGVLAAVVGGFTLWATAPIWGRLFTQNPEVLAGVGNFWIWLARISWVIVAIRYYVLLSIARVVHSEINGYANTSFAIVSITVAPVAIYVALNLLGMELVAVNVINLIVIVIQLTLFERKLRQAGVHVPILQPHPEMHFSAEVPSPD